MREEVTVTFSAALADPEVAEQVAAGTLLRAAHWAGFGPGIGTAIGTAPAPARAPRSRPAHGKPETAKQDAAAEQAEEAAEKERAQQDRAQRERAEREREHRQAVTQADRAATEAEGGARGAAPTPRERAES